MGMLLWIWWCSSVYYQRFAAGVVVSPDWIIRYLLLVWWCQSAVAALQYFHSSSFSLWELPLHLDFSFRFVLLLFSLFQIACPAVGGVGSWQLRTTLTATMLRTMIWDSLELIDLRHDLDWFVCLVFWAKRLPRFEEDRQSNVCFWSRFSWWNWSYRWKTCFMPVEVVLLNRLPKLLLAGSFCVFNSPWSLHQCYEGIRNGTNPCQLSLWFFNLTISVLRKSMKRFFHFWGRMEVILSEMHSSLLVLS